jgi:hypothetical protein
MPVMSRRLKAAVKVLLRPVAKRVIPIISNDTNTTRRTPNRVARNPPIKARQRYPIKLPVPIKPTWV